MIPVIYIVFTFGILCTDGKHDTMDFYHCSTKPEPVYAATELGCDVRIEGIHIWPTESQVKAMKKSGDVKIVDCRKENK
jgi:hypothetical protein